MIKGLTLQLNAAGNIKIGKKGEMITSQLGKEFRPPEKLDHFQITTTEKDANGDYIVDINLENNIKAAGTGIINGNGDLIGIPIRLLYNDTDLNFPTRLASYVSGKLSCTGDGETATKRVDDFTKTYPCPCPRIEQGYDGKDKCKAMGTLSCVIDEAGLFGQAHKFRTTSMNSIKGILGGLELIRTATNGRIAGLPLMLTINPKTTTTPQGQNTIVYVVSVCYRGSMSDLRHDVLNLISEERQYLIGLESLEAETKQNMAEKSDISDAEQVEIAEEFYPDSIEVASDIAASDEIPKSVEPLPPVSEIESNTDLPEDPPTGPYKEIYDRLCEETDYDKAVALVKRLMKNNIVYWLTQKHPAITIPDDIKKPDLIKLCEKVLTCLVKETSVNVEKEEAITPPVTEIETDTALSVQWDDSGLIEKEQLRQLVKLKRDMEMLGIVDPAKPETWAKYVADYLDADGKPHESATKLSRLQGNALIENLEQLIADITNLPF
ncbi:MAG: hypothetical protein AB7U45_10330 [Desulfamplus sp.]